MEPAFPRSHVVPGPPVADVVATVATARATTRPVPVSHSRAATGPGARVEAATALPMAAMPPGVPATWAYPDVALPRLLADAVRDFPDVAAVELDVAPSLTYTTLAGLVDRLAMGLQVRQVGRLVLGDAGPMATTVCLHAAWRAGVAVVLVDQVAGSGESRRGNDRQQSGDDQHGDAGSGDAGSGHAGVLHRGAHHDVSDLVPGWDPDRDVMVASRRLLSRLAVPARAGLRDDLGRWGVTRSRVAAVVGQARRLALRARPGVAPSLAALMDGAGQGVLPVVSPDAVAVVHHGPTGTNVFTHRQVVAAAFQVRLWLPDMAAGTERVAAAMDLTAPGALVLGPVLAVLCAATLLVDPDPVASLDGATVGFATPTTWREVARRGRGWGGRLGARSWNGGAATMLRIGGVVPADRGDVMAAADVRAIASHTEGARLRHFWLPPSSAGPVVAQPVYGRISGTPGAVALPDTVVRVEGGRVVAAGPQLPVGAPTGWVDVTDHVPRPGHRRDTQPDVTVPSTTREVSR